MFYYFNVYAGNKHIDLVKATGEKDAIEKCYMRYGSASKYTGMSRDNFRAVRA